MCDFVLLAEKLERGRFGNSLWQSRARRIHVDPNVTVSLFTGIMTGKNALDFQFVLRSEGRNLDALPAAGVEAPAVVGTFNGVAVHPAVGQRDAAVGAGITHRKSFSSGSAAQDQRHFQEQRLGEFLGAK